MARKKKAGAFLPVSVRRTALYPSSAAQKINQRTMAPAWSFCGNDERLTLGRKCVFVREPWQPRDPPIVATSDARDSHGVHRGSPRGWNSKRASPRKSSCTLQHERRNVFETRISPRDRILGMARRAGHKKSSVARWSIRSHEEKNVVAFPNNYSI